MRSGLDEFEFQDEWERKDILCDVGKILEERFYIECKSKYTSDACDSLCLILTDKLEKNRPQVVLTTGARGYMDITATHYIKRLMDLNPNFRLGAIILKEWARFSGFIAPDLIPQGEAMTTLWMYFLRVGLQEPHLPQVFNPDDEDVCLSALFKSTVFNSIQIDYSAGNHVNDAFDKIKSFQVPPDSLASLLYKFMRFFGWEFNYTNHIIDVLTPHGKRLIKPRKRREWRLNDIFAFRDNSLSLSAHGADVLLQGFRAADWCLQTMADWTQLLTGKDISAERPFLHMYMREEDATQMTVMRILREMRLLGAPATKAYIVDASSYRNWHLRDDMSSIYLQFESVDEARKAQDLCMTITSTYNKEAKIKMTRTSAFKLTQHGCRWKLVNESCTSIRHSPLQDCANYIKVYLDTMAKTGLWGFPSTNTWCEWPNMSDADFGDSNPVVYKGPGEMNRILQIMDEEISRNYDVVVRTANKYSACRDFERYGREVLQKVLEKLLEEKRELEDQIMKKYKFIIERIFSKTAIIHVFDRIHEFVMYPWTSFLLPPKKLHKMRIDLFRIQGLMPSRGIREPRREGMNKLTD
tara:strand:+ start:386 stop:2131 length:1746 start_codon:yes stop_codon:yes gene_type:complete